MPFSAPSDTLHPARFWTPQQDFRARTSSSAVTFRRMKLTPGPEGVALQLRNEDGYFLILQLQQADAHDFWVDGAYRPAPDTGPGCINIVDLEAAPIGLLHDPVDSVHIHIPARAVIDLAMELDASEIATLHAKAAWTTNDTVLWQASPLLLSCFESRDPPDPLFLDHLGLALAAHIVRTYGGVLRRTEVGGLSPERLRRAQDLLIDTLADTPSLVEIAAGCGLSVAHFSRAFKISTGMAPYTWQLERRLERAQHLLSRTQFALVDVAIACGYADQSHFTRAFSRRFGSSPGAYRRQTSLRGGSRSFAGQAF